MRHFALSLVFLAGLMAAGVSFLGAQVKYARTPGELSLQAVLDGAAVGNSQMHTDWLRTVGFRGQRIARNAPFDLQLQSTLQQHQDKKPLTPLEYALQQGTTYQVAVSRQLRSGITLAPSVAVSRARFAVPGAPAAGSAEAGLSLAVPLLYNRGGAVTSRAIEVADLDMEVVTGSWHTTVNGALLGVVGAYWSYVAAVDRAVVQRGAEARAQRLLDETTQLVAKEERAPADLQQLRATVASRRAARILSEQAVDEARVQLGTLMGIDAAGTLGLGAPTTPFPAATDSAAAAPLQVARLEALARVRRADLGAVRTSNRAFELELEQFRHAQKPRLDLVVNLGYQGFTQGQGFDHLVSPLFRNVPGLNASVRLRYDRAFTNSAALGQVMQEAALLEQQRVRLLDVERQVTTDVAVSALGLERAVVARRESEHAVALYRLTVENEQRKLKLGMNTLFDVINAEDALTNALLTAINNRRVHAMAIAGVRAATGTIAEMDGEVVRVDQARLLSPP